MQVLSNKVLGGASQKGFGARAPLDAIDLDQVSSGLLSSRRPRDSEEHTPVSFLAASPNVI